jgi:SAM-dependent methyltransferase
VITADPSADVLLDPVSVVGLPASDRGRFLNDLGARVRRLSGYPSRRDDFSSAMRQLGVAEDPWNVNIHYDALLAALVPISAESVLDVGCGDGFLSARLAHRTRLVVALDVDDPVIARARTRWPDAPVNWTVDDVMSSSALEPGTFDAVVSNATLHHLPDAEIALQRLGELVAPGGLLAVVTFVRSRVADWPWQVLAWTARGVSHRRRGKFEHTAPQCWPPRDTIATLSAAARRQLPGVRVRRLLYGRVLLTWLRE